MDYNVINEVEKMVSPQAANYVVLPEYWIHGCDEDYDESESYCYECAEKRIAELALEDPDSEYLIAGGYGSEGDSQRFCEKCEAALDNSFTDYAAEQELDHFEEYGFDRSSPSDCYSLLQVIGATGCGNSEVNQRIEALAKKVLLGQESA